MSSKQKLELTWIGKEKRPRLEPRILVEVPEKSYHAKEKKGDNDQFENMLIHGDNLLALKALEQEYSGQIKCIYIDPPYNTGNAFDHYDDCLEHSIWLGLMRERLILLQKLLSKDGTIWIQIDDEEQAYLKILCDEIFGRENFINMVSVNMKNIAGASGGGEDKRLKKNCEYILIYAKDYHAIIPFAPAYTYTPMYDVYLEFQKAQKNWHYNSVLYSAGIKEYCCSTQTGNGDEIKIFKRPHAVIKSIKQISELENISIEEVFEKYSSQIFEAKDAQSSIRTRVIQAKQENSITDDIVSIEYIPISGRNKGETYEQFYKGESCRLFAWLGDISENINGTLCKKTKVGTYWDYTPHINNLTKEGSVVFPDGKKPEALVQRIFEMATVPGDFVLDSFLGSGTTAAVAHKMGRRWIGIELGDHCYTHCIPRLQKVIDGTDQGGITKAVDWQGGGGFRFFKLGESLIQKDKWGQEIINKNFNAEMLAQALCKIEGFIYAPSKDEFFIHGHSTENDFIYVTTNFMTAEYLKSISEQLGEKRSLLICCKGFESSAEFSNLTVKKIPKAVLDKCEWGHDDYSLNVANLPMSASVPVQAELFDDIEGDEK